MRWWKVVTAVSFVTRNNRDNLGCLLLLYRARLGFGVPGARLQDHYCRASSLVERAAVVMLVAHKGS